MLDFQKQQLAFTQRVRNPESSPCPENIDASRMQVYEELMFNNVTNIIKHAFPIIFQVMKSETWVALVRDYFSSHHAKSPIFYDIPQEFLLYLQQERNAENDPCWLVEMAHYEWVELVLDLSEEEVDFSQTNLKESVLEQCLQVSPLAQLLSYHYPVHQIGPNFTPDKTSEELTHIIVYRGVNDEVQFMQVNLFTARLVELLGQGEGVRGGQVLNTLVDEMEHPNPEVVVDGGIGVLEELRGSGILIC